MAKCRRRSSSAASGARRDANAVEPTMSVNNTVTFSVVTDASLQTALLTTVSGERCQPHGDRARNSDVRPTR
jgi:hypothetical protein